MRVAGLRVVVSGGASGLGLGVVRRLVREGASVAVLDRDEVRGQAIASELGVFFLPADVCEEAAVATAIAEVCGRFGGLDCAVACAGVLGPGRVLGKEGPMPLSFFEKTVRVNLVGSFNLAKAAAERMQHNPPGEDGERGLILFTASIAAFEGQIGQAAYSASKAGVIGMTLPIARELARFGIRVAAIAPGVFHTPMIEGVPEEVYRALCAQVPFPSRLGTVDEFADAVLFAIGNRYFNGAVLRLDGALRLPPR
ncbi:MAG: 3-hydroxyacyl-CoA dehydrogenase [Lysobacterales bacterium]|nr:MAG: 3-hydroxyacyl-CoA dehydrogenase [Xanthomonadales bacterium]